MHIYLFVYLFICLFIYLFITPKQHTPDIQTWQPKKTKIHNMLNDEIAYFSVRWKTRKQI